VVRLDGIGFKMITLERVGVSPIVEKMVDNKLRWFGHAERRPIHSLVRSGTGRSRKTIKKDLEINELDQNMVYDRTLSI